MSSQGLSGRASTADGTEGDVSRFPEGFLWGAATSAYQVEGAVDVEGRGASIWDRFVRVPGAIERGDTGDRACDHYRRWREDVETMASLGLNAYRFSLAWPRIVPDGYGRVEPRGLAHYDRLIDLLLERGITPLVTLYHWDLPAALGERGGWRDRDTAARMAEYAAVCFDAFGDRVSRWVTVNEPWVVGLLGHHLGIHAPGETDLTASVRVFHHLLLAHGAAAQALRDSGRDGSLGVAYSLYPHVPDTDSEADLRASRLSDGYVNRWFLDPVLRGNYPDDMREQWERAVGPLDFIRDGDLSLIGSKADFVGVNYYTRRIMRADPEGSPFPWTVAPGRPDIPRTGLNWEIVPDELTSLLVRLRDDYGDVPLFITENGAAHEESLDQDGELHDPYRVAFLHSHLAAVHRAIAAGVPVRGYFHWSLLDNFEWAMGYRPRFGLVHVDYDTGRRVVKDSGRWYSGVARANAIPRETPVAAWRTTR